jgi:hypothetical protein
MADHTDAQHFDVKDYINAANDASKRTRTVTIVLVVASVIVFVGWYNSLDSSWMLQRVRIAYDPASHFVGKKLHTESNPALTSPDKNNVIPEDAFRKQFQDALVKSYVDSTYFIKAPFFGIVLDVNDVGFIGGIALVCILVLLRFSLSREIKNLNFTFDEAVTHNHLYEFYYELAMHQVFTIPKMRKEKRNRLLAIAPRIVCLLPAVVYSLGTAYDYYTIFKMGLFAWSENLFLIVFEAICFIAIWWLSLRCWERQSHINGIWDKFWPRVDGGKSRVILLAPELVDAFGEDELANAALKEVSAGRGIPNP